MCLVSSWEYLVLLVFFGLYCMLFKFFNVVFKKFLFWMWLIGLLYCFVIVIFFCFFDILLLVLVRVLFDYVSV